MLALFISYIKLTSYRAKIKNSFKYLLSINLLDKRQVLNAIKHGITEIYKKKLLLFCKK